MKKTKLLTTLSALVLVLSLGACEESTSQDGDIEGDSEDPSLGSETLETDPNSDPEEEDEEEKFTIWCPSEIKELTEKQIERYTSQFTGEDEFPYKIVVESVSLADAAVNVIVDCTVAGDIFFFTQESLVSLVHSDALSPVSDDYFGCVKTRNASPSIEMSTIDSTLYAYPASYDNGYFAYYNKSILSEDDLATQEGLIDALTAYNTENGTNYNVSFAIGSSGWYNAAYFFGTGCVSEWGTDNDRQFVDYYDTYNSNPDGYDALEGMAQLMNSGVWVDSSAASDFASNSAVVISGTWDSDTAHQLLGDNFAAAPLWNVTIPASTRALYGQEESRTYHLGSFSGSTLVGVKTNDDEKETWGHAIANYLTSEQCQLERYYSSGWGPSNLAAQKNEDVAADEVLQALYAQNEYATMQGEYPDFWWEVTTIIGSMVRNANTSVLTKEQCEDIFDYYDSCLETILLANISWAYAVVGNLEGCSWQTHPVAHGSGYPQYAFSSDNAEYGTYSVDSDGTIHGKWTTTIDVVSEGVTLTDGSGVGLIRIVDYGSWTGNFGYSELTSDSLGQEFEYDNNIALTPGTYNLVFDYTSNSPAITISAIQ